MGRSRLGEESTVRIPGGNVRTPTDLPEEQNLDPNLKRKSMDKSKKEKKGSKKAKKGQAEATKVVANEPTKATSAPAVDSATIPAETTVNSITGAMKDAHLVTHGTGSHLPSATWQPKQTRGALGKTPGPAPAKIKGGAWGGMPVSELEKHRALAGGSIPRSVLLFFNGLPLSEEKINKIDQFFLPDATVEFVGVSTREFKLPFHQKTSYYFAYPSVSMFKYWYFHCF